MKKILLAFIFLFCNLLTMTVGNVFAQNPLVKMWDKRHGGSYWDVLSCFQKTKDGGYILAGASASYMSGNKSQGTQGLYDYWIVKVDSLGNKQWDKDFGGIEDDYLYACQQTSGGGYILGGYSFSGIGGDKTQASNDTSTMQNYRGDYWIVKTDSLGIKQWDKSYGGYNSDMLYSLQQTTDNGYILGGASISQNSGDKTYPTKDTSLIYPGGDFWVIKIDSLGNKQWDKDYGGYDLDYLYSLKQVGDGGYLLGGTSSSGINGD